jgi:hypothetical protein
METPEARAMVDTALHDEDDDVRALAEGIHDFDDDEDDNDTATAPATARPKPMQNGQVQSHR